RRSVIRADVARSRAPAPKSAVVHPTSVVEWSESPRRIVNPGPAPRSDPHPVAEAVGSPSRRYCRGNPNRTVGRDIAPGAVLVEILVADHVRRYIARCHDALFALVPNQAPVVKAVGSRSFIDLVCQRVSMLKTRAFVGADA